MAILISFLELLLYIAIIILIAYVIVWVVQGFMGWTIDPNVMKFGKIVVGLLCLITIVIWLSSVLGLGGPFPHFLYR